MPRARAAASRRSARDVRALHAPLVAALLAAAPASLAAQPVGLPPAPPQPCVAGTLAAYLAMTPFGCTTSGPGVARFAWLFWSAPALVGTPLADATQVTPVVTVAPDGRTFVGFDLAFGGAFTAGAPAPSSRTFELSLSVLTADGAITGSRLEAIRLALGAAPTFASFDASLALFGTGGPPARVVCATAQPCASAADARFAVTTVQPTATFLGARLGAAGPGAVGSLAGLRFGYFVGPATVVPEPATLLLVGAGLMGVGAVARRRSRP